MATDSSRPGLQALSDIRRIETVHRAREMAARAALQQQDIVVLNHRTMLTEALDVEQRLTAALADASEKVRSRLGSGDAQAGELGRLTQFVSRLASAARHARSARLTREVELAVAVDEQQRRRSQLANAIIRHEQSVVRTGDAVRRHARQRDIRATSEPGWVSPTSKNFTRRNPKYG